MDGCRSLCFCTSPFTPVYSWTFFQQLCGQLWPADASQTVGKQRTFRCEGRQGLSPCGQDVENLKRKAVWSSESGQLDRRTVKAKADDQQGCIFFRQLATEPG